MRPVPEACISAPLWQAMQSMPFFERWASPSPRSPVYSSPTRLPWQAMHWFTMSGFFWKTWPLMSPLLANFGRLTWHCPQLEWQAVQWFLRPGSTTVSQCSLSSPARAFRTTLKEESVACSEVWPVFACSSWHSAQTSFPAAPNGGASVGSLTTPLWASARATAAGLPPWHSSHAFSAWSVLKNSGETSTLSCGANGATEPPQPLPAWRAEAAGTGSPLASSWSFALSVWQATQLDVGFAAASAASAVTESAAPASTVAPSRRRSRRRCEWVLPKRCLTSPSLLVVCADRSARGDPAADLRWQRIPIPYLIDLIQVNRIKI